MENKEQLRLGLVNYIGAMISTSNLSDEADTRHSVVAVLLEEAIKLCREDNETYNMFVCKPILKATRNILLNRIKELEKAPQIDEIIIQKQKYGFIVNDLDTTIKNIKNVK